MSRPAAIHRLIVTAFAAWMLFCCCEKRLFAALFFPEAALSLACCPPDGADPAAPEVAEAALPTCCRACNIAEATCSEDVPGGDQDDETGDGAPCRDGDPCREGDPCRDEAPHGRCCDSCCTKAPAPTTTCTLDRDEIGRELPPFIAEAFAGEETRAGAHAFDRSDGRPPPLWRTPRLQLVTTARLRI